MSPTTAPKTGWTREQMAQRAAQDIPDGSYVNLGIGIPELVARFVPEGRELIYHTENGLLGMGPVARAGTRATPSSSMPARSGSRRSPGPPTSTTPTASR
jgi:acyl CoA:acetate/3-ketoacid CoA transferase beta subunit